ncbi:MAG: diguanylate cyclase [Candidatus Delongbacteria bacterium]|nr:diguanylate cyclase [Candidatus Delongbacteria bacterium]
MDKPAVLIVDDSEINLFYLKELLKRYDIDIECADSGAQCLAILDKQEFTLILMDVMMPDMNGIETARRIRAMNISTPIIFITAPAKDEKYILESYKNGGIDYIMKPIRTEILETRINTILKLFDQKKKMEKQTLELTDLNKRLTLEMNNCLEKDIILKKSHQIFTAIMDSMDAIVLVIDMFSHEILFSNRKAGCCLEGDLTGGEIKAKLRNAAWPESLTQPLEESVADIDHPRIREIQDAEKKQWYELREQIIPWIDGRTVLLRVATDISDRKKLEEKQKLAMAVFDNALEAIMLSDLSGTIRMVNSAFTVITGYEPEEVIGKDIEVLYSDRYDPEFYRTLREEVRQKGYWVGELWNQRKNGESYPEWLTISSICNRENQVTQYLFIFSDITIRKQFEELIKYKAYHDPLTGLPNRDLMNDRLTMAIAKADRNGSKLGIIFMNLDNFKAVNDQYGHQQGDELLREISRKMRLIIRKSDTIARYGGDEFVILLTDLTDRLVIERIAESLIMSVERLSMIRNQPISISCSMGISLYPDHAETIPELIRQADQAMYQVKKHLTPKKYCFYNADRMEPPPAEEIPAG